MLGDRWGCGGCLKVIKMIKNPYTLKVITLIFLDRLVRHISGVDRMDSVKGLRPALDEYLRGTRLKVYAVL